MGPTELEEMLDDLPFRPVRLTMTTGAMYTIYRREQASVGGLVVLLFERFEDDPRFAKDYRLLSIPNIVSAERVDRLPPPRLTRRRT